jgi:hypothetical protein
MLKLLLFVILSVIGIDMAVATDFWTEAQTTKAGGIRVNQVNAGLSGGSNTIGYYAFGQSTTAGYTQMYAGPKVNPADWMEVGAAVGVEKLVSSKWMQRSAGYLWTGKENFSLIGIYENGGSGPWHKVILAYKITPELSIGIQNQSYFGTGPRVEYSFGKSASAWGAVLKNESGPTTLIAFKIKF